MSGDFGSLSRLRKRAYLFDMDGVLVDNCRYHVLSWLEFAKRHDGRLTESQVIEWMGAPARDYLVRMFDVPLSADEIAAFASEKESVYRELYRPHIEPRKGLLALLRRAQAEEIPCAVVTGGSAENVDFVLDSLQIRGFFSCVVDASQYERGKPEPDCYLQAAARLDVAPRYCTVFEDAVNGIEAAVSAGMSVVAITGTNSREMLAAAGPGRVVDSFDDLVI